MNVKKDVLLSLTYNQINFIISFFVIFPSNILTIYVENDKILLYSRLKRWFIMKKQIAKKLTIFVLIILSCLLIFNGLFQANNVKHDYVVSAQSTIAQIEEILAENEESLETLTQSLQDEYIIKAKMAAYIYEHVELSTIEEYQELVTLLNIDEIHIFNEEGTIVEGSESKYFGYNFDSGEQMSFFKPLLTDKTLTLCQDITPNTAEEKPMMYIATWNESGTAIIQIGLEPERILEEQSQNELSYIFANMPTSEDTILFAIDSESGDILGATDEEYVGYNISDYGQSLSEIDSSGNSFYTNISDISYLCVFESIDGTLIGVALKQSVIIKTVFNDTVSLNTYFIITGFILYLVLINIFNTSILNNFNLLMEKVDKISGGNLDTKLDIHSSPEFSQLSDQLNAMVSSLLDTTTKISHVLDHVDTKIAIYEYKKDMKRVFATSKLGEILNLYSDELDLLLSDKELFEKRIQAIKNSSSIEENIYVFNGDTFLSIETLSNDDGEYGLIVDVTDSIKEKNSLKYERDYDILTDVYNRRAFFREIDKLFRHSEQIKHAAVLALDMDNLKVINDTYGHDGGDAAIKCSAKMIRQIPTQNKLLCRLGGDEFLAVIYGEENDESLVEYISQLEHSYDNATINIDCKEISVKMSAGYVFTSQYDTTYETLLKYADKALYSAKRNGRSQFVEYIEM